MLWTAPRYVLVYFQKLAPCLVGIEAGPSSHHWSRCSAAIQSLSEDCVAKLWLRQPLNRDSVE
jgi:hypothetical protein